MNGVSWDRSKWGFMRLRLKQRAYAILPNLDNRSQALLANVRGNAQNYQIICSGLKLMPLTDIFLF